MNNNITFENVLSHYIKDRVPAKDTLKHIRFVIKIYKKDNNVSYFSDTTKEIVNTWKMTLIERASRQTCNNYLRHLKLLYSFAYDEDIIDENPFLKIKMVKVFQTKYKSITIEDVNQIILYLKSNNNTLLPGWFWIVLIKTLFYTGMRRKQLVELQWKDIDFSTKQITLRAHSSKNKRTWKIPLHSEIIEDLKFIRERFYTLYTPINTSEIESMQIFNITLFNHKYQGNRLKRSQLSGFFRNLSEKTNIKCSSHRFRHRIATDLVKGHKSIKDIVEVQEFLGHTDFKTTLLYVEKDVDKIRESLEKLTPLIT